MIEKPDPQVEAALAKAREALTTFSRGLVQAGKPIKDQLAVLAVLSGQMSVQMGGRTTPEEVERRLAEASPEARQLLRDLGEWLRTLD